MATAADLAIIVTAQNKTNATLAGIRGDLKATEDRVTSFGATMQRIGERASGFIVANVVQRGFGLLEQGIGHAISAASNLNESLSKTRVVFGSASASVEQFAQGSARSLGISRQATLEATATFGNLFTAMRIAVGPAAEMSTAIVKLASDLASFNNTSPEEALIALRAGLVGEIEPLRKYGVNLNQATIEQRAMTLGLLKQGETITASAKAQAAYSIIMEQTKTAQGDFARTADGLANSQRTLKAVFDDVSASLGRALIPAANFATQELAKLGGGFDTTGTESAMLRIQISIVDMAMQAEKALTSLINLGNDAGGVLNGINGTVESAALKVNKFLHNLTEGGTLGTIGLAPGNRPPAGEVLGPPTPDNSLLGRLRANLESALANAGKDAATGITGSGSVLGDALDGVAGTVKQKTTGIGDALQGMVGTLRSAASSLFATPTREQAGINLNLDVATFALNGMQYAASQMAVSLDAASAAIGRNIDQLNEQKAKLSDEAAALSTNASNAASRASNQASYISKSDFGDNKGGEAAAKALQRTLTLEAQNAAAAQKMNANAQAAIDKKIRDAERSQKNIETQKQAQANLVAQQQRVVDGYSRQAQVLEGLHKIEQDRLVLADQTLLSEGKQQALYQQLYDKTFNLTGAAQAAADKLNINLIPGFDAAMNAGHTLADTLNNEVAGSFRNASGQVDTWMGKLDAFVTRITSLAAPSQPGGNQSPNLTLQPSMSG